LHSEVNVEVIANVFSFG